MFYYQGLDGIHDFLLSKGNFDRVVIFMALPPHAYESTVEKLHNEGFGEEVTLVVEKPFGYDIESARELNKSLTRYFNESQIFRIDHYLAKEAVQNILVFRFANSLFEPIWNHNHIESIQVNCFEDLGVEGRGAYFDKAGIIRDMVQNHLIQLLALMTMDEPVSLSAKSIRHRKRDLLEQIEVVDWCRFQCDEYTKEEGIPKDSTTETFGSIKLRINNSRWQGVDIHIRAGKYMNRKGTEIGVKFKKLPPILFNKGSDIPENRIIFKIQPAEGIIIDLASKVPGSDNKITGTTMKFCYSDHFNNSVVPEAYTKLLLDAIKADKTLFVSAEESELSWEKFDAVIKDKSKPKLYKRGEIPIGKCDTEWINFENYGSICD
jgi:glucose-6-phosphate 1-dehydrogenase